jgi:hypothetical protein
MNHSASFLRVSWMLFAVAALTVLPSLADGPLHYYTVTPCRLVDTRNPNGPSGGPKLSAGVARSFKVQAGVCGVPTGAKGVLFNVTATEAAAPGHLTLYPSHLTQPPSVSNINFVAGDTIANGATVALADTTGDDVKVYGSVGVHVILDVAGYFR